MSVRGDCKLVPPKLILNPYVRAFEYDETRTSEKTTSYYFFFRNFN